MPQQWKDFQITAESLAAFLVGLLAMGATFVSFQSWLDDRIADRLVGIERRVTELETANDLEIERYAEIRRLLEKIADE